METEETDAAVYPWHSADGLIQAFGEDAYSSGIRLMWAMIQDTPDDKESIGKIRTGVIDLMQRGYHKRGIAAQ